MSHFQDQSNSVWDATEPVVRSGTISAPGSESIFPRAPIALRGPEPSGGRPAFSELRGDEEGNVGRRRASEIKGGVDSMEDAGPHSRGRTRLQKNPRTRGGGTHLPAGAGSIVPPGPSGQTGNSPECLLQVAGASLGPRQPRRPRLPAGRRDPLPDSGPHPGILAQAELLPRVRGADVRRGVSAPGCPYHAGSLSSLCVPAGKRALLPYRPWDRG